VEALQTLAENTWQDSSDWLILAKLLKAQSESASLLKKDLDDLKAHLDALKLNAQVSSAKSSSSSASSNTDALLAKMSQHYGPKQSDPMEAVVQRYKQVNDDLYGDLIGRGENISTLVSSSRSSSMNRD
jgi:hypothetical protein